MRVCACAYIHTCAHPYTWWGDPKHKTSWHSPKHHLSSFSFYPLLTCKQSTHPCWWAGLLTNFTSFWLFTFTVHVFWYVTEVYRQKNPACYWLGWQKPSILFGKWFPLECIYIGDISHLDNSRNANWQLFSENLFFLLMTVKKPQGWSRLVTLDERGCSRTGWKPEALCFRLRSEREDTVLSTPPLKILPFFSFCF